MCVSCTLFTKTHRFIFFRRYFTEKYLKFTFNCFHVLSEIVQFFSIISYCLVNIFKFNSKGGYVSYAFLTEFNVFIACSVCTVNQYASRVPLGIAKFIPVSYANPDKSICVLFFITFSIKILFSSSSRLLYNAQSHRL